MLPGVLRFETVGDGFGKFSVGGSRTYTLNPNSYTLNPKSYTLKP